MTKFEKFPKVFKSFKEHSHDCAVWAKDTAKKLEERYDLSCLPHDPLERIRLKSAIIKELLECLR